MPLTKDCNNYLLLMYHYIISTSSIQMKSENGPEEDKATSNPMSLNYPNKMKSMIKKNKTKKPEIIFNIENEIFNLLRLFIVSQSFPSLCSI